MAAGHSRQFTPGGYLSTVIHTTLVGFETATFRLLVRRATSSATDSPVERILSCLLQLVCRSHDMKILVACSFVAESDERGTSFLQHKQHKFRTKRGHPCYIITVCHYYCFFNGHIHIHLLAPFFVELFNQSLSMGYVQAAFREAYIVCMYVCMFIRTSNHRCTMWTLNRIRNAGQKGRTRHL